MWARCPAGVVHIPDLVSWDDWKPGLALLWTAGLLPYPVVSNLLADRVSAFGEIRTLFQETIVPTLEQIPVWVRRWILTGQL